MVFNPGGGAVGVDFFFPDREAVFDIVDNIAAGQKAVASVVGDHADPDGDVAGGEGTDPVDGGGVEDVEFFFGFFQDGLCDGGCQFGVSAVVECGDRFAFVVVPHPAFVAAIRTRREGGHSGAEFAGNNRSFDELKMHVDRVFFFGRLFLSLRTSVVEKRSNRRRGGFYYERTARG